MDDKKIKHIIIPKNKPRGSYGKSKDKALSTDELNYLTFELHNDRDRVILIGNAYGGMRIGEFIQCRLSWLEWTTLDDGNNKMHVLAIKIPHEDKNIVNLNSKVLWSPKTHDSCRTTYIIDENFAQQFYSFYKKNPRGICECFKSKDHKSIERNISAYIIAVRWLKLLRNYHRDILIKKYNDIDINKDEFEDELDKKRSRKYKNARLSAHALRSTYENLLFYKYNLDIELSAVILGHTPEIARKHYISKSDKNIQMKLSQVLLK